MCFSSETPTVAAFRPTLVNGRTGDPALFVEIAHERQAVLFDLGDLSPLSARDLLRVSHVFVSHMHLDHFVGFNALLRINIGRAKRIAIVGPAGIAASIGHRLASFTWDLVAGYADDLVFEVNEILSHGTARRMRFRLRAAFAEEPLPPVALQDGKVADEPAFSVHAELLEHHGICLAFAMVEPIHVNVRRNRLDLRGLPVGPWLKPLKAAVHDGRDDSTPIALADGSSAPLGQLRDLVGVTRGEKLGYVTDIRDSAANRAAVMRLCRAADTLFIEARFAAADAELAFRRGHLTTATAGEMARAAGARRVEPFHFSGRYRGEEDALCAEVQRAFA